MKYIISPVCTKPSGGQLALAADSYGNIMVQNFNRQDPAQIWVAYYPLTKNYTSQSQPLALFNVAYQKLLGLASQDGGVYNLTLIAPKDQALDAGCAWTATGTNGFAIRSWFSDNWNLNVRGGGSPNPGTQVIAWD
jgi:hypothetical protein